MKPTENFNLKEGSARMRYNVSSLSIEKIELKTFFLKSSLGQVPHPIQAY